MMIALLGGGGFIGSAIVDRLLRDGHRLRVFERPSAVPYRDFVCGEDVQWVTGDFSNLIDVATAVEGAKVVYHVISTTLPKGSNDNPVYDVESNLVPTLRLLEMLRTTHVEQIVFISSGGTVYGEPQYLPIDEQHPTNPSVSYGITKLAIEKYLLMYSRLYGIGSTVLRVANPYGERQRTESAQGAVGVFLRRALERRPVDIWGDGSITRDYLHVSDVAEAAARVLSCRGQHNVFNISSGIGTSLDELLSVMESVLNRRIERVYWPKRPFDVPVSVLDNSLARRELGWIPAVSLAEGIHRTALWLQRDL